MKIFKFSVLFLCIICAAGFITIAAMLIKLSMNDMSINDDINYITKNEKYNNPVKINGENTPVIDNIPVSFSFSTNGSFYSEIKKQFSEYNITQYKNMKNSDLIDKIYDALSNNIPVICPYAIVESVPVFSENSENNQAEWEINYCIVTELDIPEDKITVNNPYGDTITYTIEDFLKATRFENYENMEFGLKLKFAIEIYTKNTAYILEK